MRKLLAAFGVGITCLINMHDSMAAPAGDEVAAAARREGGSARDPMVYDARGRVAGRYVPFGPVLLDTGGALIAVYAERDLQGGQYDTTALKWGANGNALYYAAQDCEGPPLINNTSGGPAGTRPVALANDSSGNLVAYVGAAGRSSTQGYRSWRDSLNGACTNTWGSAVPINTWNLEKTVIINQLYPEPLNVR